MARKQKSDGPYPTLDECNEFIEWLEENNDIDLNRVKLRVRETRDGSAEYIVSVEWFEHGSKPPEASDLLLQAGWAIDDWFLEWRSLDELFLAGLG